MNAFWTHPGRAHPAAILALAACALAMAVIPPPCPAASPADADATFTQANEAFGRTEFEEAVELYRRCLESAQSATLHYNLANSYFRAGRPGHAVLHYEKALALDPGHAEARANLKFIRKAEDLPARKGGWLDKIATALPVNTWCWLAATTFWAALGLFLLPPLFRGPSTLTRLLLGACILLLATSLAGLLGYHGRRNEVVALAPDTPLRFAPAEGSAHNGTLGAGELALLRKTRDGYHRVVSQDGTDGWVKADEVGKIWD